METKKILMQTYTGVIFDINNPKVEMVKLKDIAHALSLICRYGGQCEYFYSVAQHSLNVYEDLKNLGYDSSIQLMGLLHDASEAYIADIITPLKHELLSYKEYEEKIQNVIFQKFGLFSTDQIKSIIKTSDRDIFYNEAIMLMKNFKLFLPDTPFRKVYIDVSRKKMEDVEEEFTDTVNMLVKKI